MGKLRLKIKLFLIMLFLTLVFVYSEVKIDSAIFGNLEPRSIGPAVMSGRITDIDCVNKDPRIIYVGTAGGGVWKSKNGGITFKPIFEDYTMSIGCITIDQKNPETVWVGTGETWVRNSTSVGTGLYKTEDGGKTWKFIGFKDSERISEIVIHPENSKIVYVGVLGHLWNSNEERGVYKTEDGGKTWKRILYVDKNTGCADLDIDPQEPDVLYAAMWQFRRKPYFFTSGGPGSGLYKTIDGGKTWKKLTKGIPEGKLGRIAVDIAPSRPGTVYALIECKDTAVYRSDDMGESWKKMGTNIGVKARPFYFANIKVDPKNHNRIYNTSIILSISDDGGKKFNTSFENYGSMTVHPDIHAIWINPNNPEHILIGTDGGVYVSYDKAKSFKFFKNLPVSQFYHVSYDYQYPYWVYGGLQDNGSWCGPSRAINTGGIQNKEWENVGGGDGFYVFADPYDPDIVYNEWQEGRLQRYNKKTGEMKDIRPLPKKGEPEYRFNWNTPVILSPNDSKVIYMGAQFLLRSKDRGDSWERISPDLTTNDPKKLKQAESGGVTIDNTGAENHCTIITISESPLNSNIIWVGTDDGNLQITKDGGKKWENVVGNIPGLPPNTWCSGVEASHFKPGTAYVVFDGHRTGDMNPYIFKTTDFGKTWTSLVSSEIEGYCHVIREDLVNPDLLFLGTEFGLYISIDGGRNWARLSKLPKVGVRDIAIHPRENDLILATHGLGIQIIDDITPLRHLTSKVLNSNVAFLPSRPAFISIPGYLQEFPGDDEFLGSNPPEGAMITYYLKKRHIFGDFRLEVYDEKGNLIKALPGRRERGLNRIFWNMRQKAPKTASAPALTSRILFGPMVPEGIYTVKLTKGKEIFTEKIEVKPHPSVKHSSEDRKIRYKAIMRLYKMQEHLAYIADTIADARDQAKEIEKSKGKKLGKNLLKKIKSFAEKLDKIHKSLVQENYLFSEPKLREKVIDLYSSISGYGGKPTESQLTYIEVLNDEINEVEKKFKRIKEIDIPKLNKELTKKRVKIIKIISEKEYMEKEEKQR